MSLCISDVSFARSATVLFVIASLTAVSRLSKLVFCLSDQAIGLLGRKTSPIDRTTLKPFAMRVCSNASV